MCLQVWSSLPLFPTPPDAPPRARFPAPGASCLRRSAHGRGKAELEDLGLAVGRRFAVTSFVTSFGLAPLALAPRFLASLANRGHDLREPGAGVAVLAGGVSCSWLGIPLSYLLSNNNKMNLNIVEKALRDSAGLDIATNASSVPNSRHALDSHFGAWHALESHER